VVVGEEENKREIARAVLGGPEEKSLAFASTPVDSLVPDTCFSCLFFFFVVTRLRHYLGTNIDASPLT